jgi:NitT/TauT family transport system substrate-binding protein
MLNATLTRGLMLCLIAACCGCHRSARATSVPTVRVAIHRDAVAFVPLRVAESLGYFKEEGIAVDMPEVAGGAKAIEALLGGSVDVAVGSMSDAIALAAQGRYLRGILVLYARPTIALAVAPSSSATIRSVKDLKGHTVGVSAPGSASQHALNFLLVENGLTPDDVSTVSVGMSASSVAALEHGKVDAAVLIASAITLLEERQPEARLLADTRTPEGAKRLFGSETFPALSLLVEDAWLEKNDDTARRLVRAVKKGMHWMRDQPPKRVRDVIPQAARMATAAADLQAIRTVQAALSPDGMMSPAAAELIEKFVAVSDHRVKTAHLDLSRIYTNELAAGK